MHPYFSSVETRSSIKSWILQKYQRQKSLFKSAFKALKYIFKKQLLYVSFLWFLRMILDVLGLLNLLHQLKVVKEKMLTMSFLLVKSRRQKLGC